VEASALSAPAGLDQRSRTSAFLRLRSDEQLVGLFRSGSEDAFSVIHDRYRQRLYVYARQMLGGSGNDAEDVLQDVFLRAYRALRVDERPVSLRAWLYKVAHNRCIDHLRRPTPPAAEIYDVSRKPIHDPTLEAERREDLARLVADVRRLPEQQRSALLMREMDGMSYADLAEALETSVPAVKSLLVRARIGLVEAIEARDADCADIRHDLAASYDKGVRSSGRARRHLRECTECAQFRAQLRGVREGFAAMNPAVGMAGLAAKVLGVGSASAGAGAGASGTAVVGGTAAVSVTKVAAVVCCAAAITGGAVEVPKFVAPDRGGEVHQSPAPATGSPIVAATASAVAHSPATVNPSGFHEAPAPTHRADTALVTGAQDLALHPPVAMTPSLVAEPRNPNGTGGAEAPADTASETPAPTAQPMADDEEQQGGLAGVAEDATGVLMPADEAPAPADDDAATTSSSQPPASGSSQPSTTSSQSGTASSGGASPTPPAGR
jgi:RNA polymerase sigma factor (sigma-70 family)